MAVTAFVMAAAFNWCTMLTLMPSSCIVPQQLLNTSPDCPGIPGAFHFRAIGNTLFCCTNSENGLQCAAEKIFYGGCGSFFYFAKTEIIIYFW